MEKFIYIFDSDTKTELLSRGYRLLKCDERQKLYIFENKPCAQFSLDKNKFILTNTLSF